MEESLLFSQAKILQDLLTEHEIETIGDLVLAFEDDGLELEVSAIYAAGFLRGSAEWADKTIDELLDAVGFTTKEN